MRNRQALPAHFRESAEKAPALLRLVTPIASLVVGIAK